MKRKKIDLDMKLSRSFTVRDFTSSATAERLDIDNTPSWTHVLNMMNLCKRVVQPLCDKFGPMLINSGYRSEELNEAVHGLGLSQHLTGCAVDIHLKDVETGRKYYNYILKHCPFDQMLFEFADKGRVIWLHVSCRPENEMHLNRHMALPNYHVVNQGRRRI